MILNEGKELSPAFAMSYAINYYLRWNVLMLTSVNTVRVIGSYVFVLI